MATLKFRTLILRNLEIKNTIEVYLDRMKCFVVDDERNKAQNINF